MDGVYADDDFIRGSRDIGIGGSVDRCSDVVSEGAQVSPYELRPYEFSQSSYPSGKISLGHAQVEHLLTHELQGEPTLKSNTSDKWEATIGTIIVEIDEVIVTGDYPDEKEQWHLPYFVKLAKTPLDIDTQEKFPHRIM